MPSFVLLAPVLLPLIAAGIITAFGLSGFDLGPLLVGAGVWAAGLALLVIWLPLRATQGLNLGPLGCGSNFPLRLDAVGFGFGLMVLLPAALVLTLQPRTWQESTVGLLGVAAAMGAIEAGGAVLRPRAGGPPAPPAGVPPHTRRHRAPRPGWGIPPAAPPA